MTSSGCGQTFYVHDCFQESLSVQLHLLHLTAGAHQVWEMSANQDIGQISRSSGRPDRPPYRDAGICHSRRRSGLGGPNRGPGPVL